LPEGCFGYLPEDRGLYLDKSVSDNLLYIAKLRGLHKKQALKQLDYWLERWDLQDKRKDNLNKLSKGNQQKVQLISCLIHQPALLILDEPFSGLDPINQEHVLTILSELKQQGTTILLSAHQMALIERLTDQMLLLNKGQVVAQGNLSQVRQQLAPQQQYQVSFQQESPFAQLAQSRSVAAVSPLTPHSVLVTLAAGSTFQQLIQEMSTFGEMTEISRQQASLHDLYLQAITAHNQHQPQSQQGDAA
jgi:ABC-2 type transport system ATP-binding protein